MRRQSSSAKGKRGQPRRRVTPLWRHRAIVAGSLAFILIAGIGGGWWSWHDGWVTRAADKVKWSLIATAADLGFRVEEILVLGRQETHRDALLAAIGVSEGAPILAFDPDNIRRRVEALPWVRSAVVERKLPNTLLLYLVERQPLALWQNQGRFALIDHTGTTIDSSNVERFSDLLVVVGEDAPIHTSDLVGLLATEPDLMIRVKAAVRVGGRRWNVILDNGINVRLPQDNPRSAWSRLARYEDTHRILERDVEVLDLRLPDRLIVRQPRRNGDPTPSAGRKT